MAHRFLRKPEVLAKLGIKREALRELIDNKHFPPGTQIIPGGRAQGWIEDEVDKYIEERRELAHKEKGKFPEKGSGKAAKTMEKSNDDKARDSLPNVNRTDPTRSGQHRPRPRGATRGSTRSHK
jgi:predicted DNA-binding transcriptional regulator AlpA